MRIKISGAALLLLASGWLVAAAAQTIYRCGSSYSQQPCAGGAPVEADDARTAGQRAQTSAAAKRDAAAADAMEKARLKEEAKPAQVYVPLPKDQDAGAGGKPADTAKARKPAVFKATAPPKPGAAHAKKKKAKKKKAD